MSIRSTIVVARLAILFFLAESPIVTIFAGRYPGYVVPIVLAGVLAVSVPPGIVLARALQKGVEDELAATDQESERYFFVAATASLAGVLMASLGRGAVGMLGIVVAAGGTAAATRLLLRVALAGSRRPECFLGPADREHVE